MLANMSARDDVESFNSEFAAAFSLPSPEQLVSMYTDDAVMISNGRVTTGRGALLELFRRGFTEPSDTTFDSKHVFEDGDVVVDVGSILREGVPAARYVVIHRRQDDGSLKLFVDVPLKLS
jgi:ketosteroid isomerase-like protein